MIPQVFSTMNAPSTPGFLPDQCCTGVSTCSSQSILLFTYTQVVLPIPPPSSYWKPSLASATLHPGVASTILSLQNNPRSPLPLPCTMKKAAVTIYLLLQTELPKDCDHALLISGFPPLAWCLVHHSHMLNMGWTLNIKCTGMFPEGRLQVCISSVAPEGDRMPGTTEKTAGMLHELVPALLLAFYLDVLSP